MIAGYRFDVGSYPEITKPSCLTGSQIEGAEAQVVMISTRALSPVVRVKLSTRCGRTGTDYYNLDDYWSPMAGRQGVQSPFNGQSSHFPGSAFSRGSPEGSIQPEGTASFRVLTIGKAPDECAAPSLQFSRPTNWL